MFEDMKVTCLHKYPSKTSLPPGNLVSIFCAAGCVLFPISKSCLQKQIGFYINCQEIPQRAMVRGTLILEACTERNSIKKRKQTGNQNG